MFLKILKNKVLRHKKDRIEKEFDSIIQRAVEDLADHQGIRRSKIIRWMSQFPPKSGKLSAKILKTIKYYSTSNISIMTKELVDTVFNIYNGTNRRNIFFVPIGTPGSGSQIVARHLKNISKVPKANIIDLLKLHNISKQRIIEVIILIDDFSGTGQTIYEWWQNVETLILPINAQVGLGLLVLNYKARSKLQNIINKIVSVNDLEENENVFDENCKIFTDKEKRQLLSLC